MLNDLFEKIIDGIIFRKPKWNLELLVMFLLVGIDFGFVLYKSRFSLKQKIVAVILYVYSANVLVITMLGRGHWEISDHMRATFVPFFLREPNYYLGESMGSLTLEFFLNIAMFLPLGLLVPLLQRGEHKYRNTIIIGIASTLFLEITQCVSGMGVLQLDDIVANSVGTVLGALLHRKIIYFLRQKERHKNEYTGRN